MIDRVKDDGREAARRLADVLRDVPFLPPVRVDHAAGKGGAVDFAISLRPARGTHRLYCKWIPNGQPRFARDSCLRLAGYLRSGRRGYPVLIAPYLSPVAAAVCREAEVGYLDLAGNCRLAFDRVFILREGYPNHAVRKRFLRGMYSPKAERVLRVILNAGRRSWRTQPLAREAGVSLGQVANVKRMLLDREWIEQNEDGFRLRSFDDAVLPLLEDWASNYRAARSQPHEFYSMRPTPEIELSIGSREGSALTGLSGAARFAPAVRYQRVTAYAGGDIAEAARAAGLKSVAGGGNVILLKPYDEGVFCGARAVDGVRIVSPVQLYLDLSAAKGRSGEAAGQVLQEVIQPLWL